MIPDVPASVDSRALESLLAFWRDAGVNACFEDEAVDRLDRPAPPIAVARAAGQAAIAPLRPEAPDLSDAVEDARRIAAAANSIAELRAAIETFEGCSLRFGGAKQAVFARGPENAPLMVIGEAPGADEDAAGTPLAGPAGRLLDRMLAAAGLAERAFVTNVVFWRPMANRNPSTLECAVCAPFLERAITLVRPKALLLLGASAARTVLRKEENILSLRGRWFDHVSESDARVTPALATLNPGFLLRTPAAKKQAWRDVLTTVARVDAPDGADHNRSTT